MLEFRNISKEFYGNYVLKNLNIRLEKGEILGLVGENGAGKSTLMNILFGMPVIFDTGGFEGEIYLKGKKVDIKSPKDAMDLGIGMIHQEFMLIPGFTVFENIKLNRELTRPNLLSKLMKSSKLETLNIPLMRRDSKEALEEIGLGIDELLPIIGLPVGYKQFVEIAREVDKAKNDNLELLVFDEPTAVLTESEADRLLEIIRNLAKKGISIIFISHRLDEVIKLSDRIIVLRDGEKVAEKLSSQTNVLELAELMVGRKMKLDIGVKRKSPSDGEVILKIKDLYVDMPGERVRGIDLEVKRGEILGIGGLAGHGKAGIANGIAGLYPAKGEVKFKGKDFTLNDPLEFLTKGMAFLSEDRRGVGLMLDESLELNIGITAFYIKGRFSKEFLGVRYLDSKSLREWALKMIKDLDIRCIGPQQLVRSLSGGNQQKVCIARALTLEPEILFVSEPTRGIDVGAKQKVLELLVRFNQELGMTIVFTSSELQELKAISDRIAIVHQGKIADILSPFASDADFGLTMSGLKVKS
ncbi:MAG: sugar ABC transporter ATP-binding protein [Dictyoglomaceae bacterium]